MKMEIGSGNAPMAFSLQAGGRLGPAPKVLSGLLGVFLFCSFKCHGPTIGSCLYLGAARRSGQDPFIVGEGILDFDAVGCDFKLSQAFVMVASSHLENSKESSHGGLDLDWFQENDRDDQETEACIADREGVSHYLGCFAEEYRSDVLRIVGHDRSLDLCMRLILWNDNRV